VRGNPKQVNFTQKLLSKIQMEGWRWSAHVHPGTKDIVLRASGIPGDRQALQVFDQSQSLILNSAGRRNIFNLTEDISVVPKSEYNHVQSTSNFGKQVRRRN
jgi:hypothetical protein